MFDSNILDVLIGVVFVFLLLSVATSWFVEFIAQIFRIRATHLKKYLKVWMGEYFAGTGLFLHVEDILGKIDKIDEKQLLEIARDIFRKEGLNLAVIGPQKEKEKDELDEILNKL